MERIERSVVVDRPTSMVYDQWTQFEEFPRFMEGVESVEQVDDAHLRWVASIAGKRAEWQSEIVQQEPDRVISWRGFGDPDQTGTVMFEPEPQGGTRVTAMIEYEPQGAVEKIGDALGLVDARVEGDLQRFKSFIESREVPTGGWRGEIEGGDVRQEPGTGSVGTGGTPSAGSDLDPLV